MEYGPLPILLAPVLLSMVLASAGGNPAHVVINEVDVNPPGDDAAGPLEWIELYNPTGAPADMSGWQVVSGLKTMTFSQGTSISAGGFMTFTYQPSWFADGLETVRLVSAAGETVDETAPLSDPDGDHRSWQRTYDAFGGSAASDWKLAPPTRGYSNGKVPSEVDTDALVVRISSDMASYLPGDAITLTGSVSKQVQVYKPTFQPAQIVLVVTGPIEDVRITRYPDLNSQFSVVLVPQTTRMMPPGQYTVDVVYSDATASTAFDIVLEGAEDVAKETRTLAIELDRDSYVAGDVVKMAAISSSVVQFEGLEFSVLDPGGNVVSRGTLFPASDAAEFHTTILLEELTSMPGTYTITAKYSEIAATKTFEVTPRPAKTTVLDLHTDREAYAPGQTVLITGSLNKNFEPVMTIEIVQSVNMALDTVSGTPLKILDDVRLEGDGSFSYMMEIPAGFNRFGEYAVTVSGDAGKFTRKFAIVKDPQNFVRSSDPLSLVTDRQVYNLGERVRVSGTILDDHRDARISAISITVVGGTIRDADAVVHTSIPTQTGDFAAEVDLPRTKYSVGEYMVKAKYGRLSASAPITLADDLNTSSTEIIAFLDREVYGLGETVSLVGTFGAQTRDSQEVSIVITKPSGDTDQFGTLLDGGHFEWSWQAPSSEAPVYGGERGTSHSNLGVYKMTISTGERHVQKFFKISADPENDSLEVLPLAMMTDRSVYELGDTLTISGTVKMRESIGGGIVPDPVLLDIFREGSGTSLQGSSVYPDFAGAYRSEFKLPHHVFSAGEYRIVAIYGGERATGSFSITGGLTVGGDAPVELLAETDRPEYHPGDTVSVSARPSKIIHTEGYKVSVAAVDDRASCGSFHCAVHVGRIHTVLPDSSSALSYSHYLPDDAAAGTYEVTVESNFDVKRVQFEVVPKPIKYIHKESRMTDTRITITPEKLSGLEARVITGFVIPAAGVSSDLRVSSGTECIVGPGCAVSVFTRTADSLYAQADAQGTSYKIRYSGPDAKLEKFSILEWDGGELPATPYVVEIDADGATRFYYTITYVPPG